MASGKQVLCHKESPDSDVHHTRTEAPDLREGHSADGDFAASRKPKGSHVVPYRSTHASGPHVAPVSADRDSDLTAGRTTGAGSARPAALIRSSELCKPSGPNDKSTRPTQHAQRFCQSSCIGPTIIGDTTDSKVKHSSAGCHQTHDRVQRHEKRRQNIRNRKASTEVGCAVRLRRVHVAGQAGAHR